MLERGNCLVT